MEPEGLGERPKAQGNPHVLSNGAAVRMQPRFSYVDACVHLGYTRHAAVTPAGASLEDIYVIAAFEAVLSVGLLYAVLVDVLLLSIA